MNTTSQILHVLRFQFASVPWFMWLVLGVCLVMTNLGGVILAATDLVGPLEVGISRLLPQIYFFILAVQLSFGFVAREVLPNQNWVTGGTDFLHTRALDRAAIFWAKLGIFAMVCAAVALGYAGPVLGQAPFLVRYEHGSHVAAALMATPSLGAVHAGRNEQWEVLQLAHGALVVASYCVLQVVLIAAGTLLVAMRLRGSVWRMLVFFGAFILVTLTVSLGPVLLRGTEAASRFEWLAGLAASAFLLYARHPLLVWLGTLAVVAGIVAFARRAYLQTR